MIAVILAGGKGTRLKPYTNVFPKPLMPIGDHPILEILIRQLESNGFTDIFMAVGHLAELIKLFFGEGDKYNVNITYKKENEPLGTAGPLGQMKDELDDHFIMMNGDLLTTINFKELVDYHKKSGAIATIALKKRNVHIDFGVVEVDDANDITDYIEKPDLEYLVSMGVYVFDPRVLEYIEPGKYLDFPDLIKKLISNGEKVKGYPYDGYWLDMGRPDDYEKANEKIDELYPELFK